MEFLNNLDNLPTFVKIVNNVKCEGNALLIFVFIFRKNSSKKLF
jgi:hypothetical protein